jgi:transcriptional regulator with XRE-family HTH domain
MDEETTGARLRAWREKIPRSQTSCAAEAKTSQSTWASWERDEAIPEVDYCETIERMTDGYVRVADWAKARRTKRMADRAKDESGTDVDAAAKAAG